jgi:hypothetical protein
VPQGVDRTFLYRHRDLLEKIHAAEATPPPGGETAGPAVTRASLQADLLAAHERAIRLSTRVRQLEQRLSDALGEQAWRESGLGAPADIDALHQKITHLEQQAADLRLQLEERGDELSAARAANRELMTRLNHSAATRHTIVAPHLLHPVTSSLPAADLRKRGDQAQLTGISPWRRSATPPTTKTQIPDTREMAPRSWPPCGTSPSACSTSPG